MGLSQSNHLEDLSDDSESNDEGLGPDKGVSSESNIITSDCSVDATLKPTVSLPTARDTLKLESLANIEKQLDIAEVISLVYLVVDERHYALQQLLLLLKNPDSSLSILQEWAQKNTNNNWENTLVEALCLIKNYKILKQLGFIKNSCKQHYLPHIYKVSLHVKIIRKTCYLICEKLDKISTSKLLNYFKSATNEKCIDHEYQYLELLFLKIEIDNNRKIGEITTALKSIGEEELYDMLKDIDIDMVEPKPNGDTYEYENPEQTYESKTSCVSNPSRNASLNNNKHSTSTDTHARVNRDTCNNMLSETLSPSICSDEDTSYPINFDNPGTVLIINQEHFYTEFDKQFKHLLPNELRDKLESRVGSEKDSNDLRSLFLSYGFNVIVEKNLTHLEMESKIKEVVNGIRDESSLFICILSHGDKGVVYAANSCAIKVSAIQKILCKTNKKHLNGKPKVLILQACQGDECQKVDSDTSDSDNEENRITVDGRVPPATDLLTFWATVPGYAAIRDKKRGTWFIQTFCKVIEANSHKLHLSDMCTKVVKEVASKKYQKTGMTPMVVNTFRFSFYFPPSKK